MNVNKFIRKLLNLKGLKVVDFQFLIRLKTFYIWVKPYKNGALCPFCLRRGRIISMLETRKWRDLPIGGWTVFFKYAPREIQCPTHGRVQENIPWADEYARITFRFEYTMLIYCQIMIQKAAARILHTPKSTLSDILHRSITRIRAGHRIRGLKSLGIDEISYCKGHKYATIVYDLDRSCVVWVGKGKSREVIDKFFDQELSEYQKKQIKFASCDMAETYIHAIEEHCPNATLVLDRFHVVKALNSAMDDVRKKEWREASKTDRKVLKGMRWLLFMNSANRSKGDSHTINLLRKVIIAFIGLGS